MPKFNYKASNSLGSPVSGSVVSETENGAIAELRMKGYSDIQINKSSFGGFLGDLDAKIQKMTASTKVSMQEIAIVFLLAPTETCDRTKRLIRIPCLPAGTNIRVRLEAGTCKSHSLTPIRKPMQL